MIKHIGEVVERIVYLSTYYLMDLLTLLHSEKPKLHTILALLSAIELSVGLFLVFLPILL